MHNINYQLKIKYTQNNNNKKKKINLFHYWAFLNVHSIIYMFFLCIMILYYHYISTLYRNYIRTKRYKNNFQFLYITFIRVYVCLPCLSVTNFVDMVIDKIIDSIKMFYVYLYFQQ